MKSNAEHPLPWCPALLLAVCFGIGITLQEWSQRPIHSWMTVIVLAFLLLIGISLRPKRRLVDRFPMGSAALIAVATITAGGLRLALTQETPRGHVEHIASQLDGREIKVRGVIASYVQERGRGSRFHLDMDFLVYNADTLATRGRLLINIREQPQEDLHRGQRIVLRGEYAERPVKRNPADFDYGTYLRRQGISGIIYSSGVPISILDSRRPIVYRVVENTRGWIDEVITRRVRSASGQLVLRALLLGDRSGLSSGDRERLARSGLMHLLAVSGLHVLLVGMVLYQLLRPTLLRLRFSWRAAEWARSAITVLILLMYMLLTGSSPSVVRAVIMASLFIGATLAQRPIHSMNTLGAAGLTMLFLHPYELFGAGFQLSFSAVGGIMLFSGHMRMVDEAVQKIAPLLRYAVNSILVSLAATTATLPVLLFHFGRASFAGLILNIIAIPATFGALSSGILLVLTESISGVVALQFGSAADFLANVVLWLAHLGERWSRVALIEQHVRNGWWLGAISCAAIGSALFRYRLLRWRLTIVIIAMCTGGVWTSQTSSPALDVIFFDVGQGDAVLVRTPSGRTMLVDAGPRTQTFDAGERILHQNLSYFGIDRLDAVVITHPHSDHLGGLPHLLRAMRIDRVYHNGTSHESGLVVEVDHLLDSLSIHHQAVTAGDTISIDPAVSVKVLAPVQPESSTINDASVVLRLTHGESSILLTGDAETSSELLLAQYFHPVLQATLIKAGHHGSSTSSTIELVRRAQLDSGDGHVVVSVGKRNRYRHPSIEVVDRWRASGRDVRLTSDDGALWFRSDGTTLAEIKWK